jgi:hypothetical protein
VADMYTDPQIHSISAQGYGQGNLGMRGVTKFLESHTCNHICRVLGLPAKAGKFQNAGTVVPGGQIGCKKDLGTNINSRFAPAKMEEVVAKLQMQWQQELIGLQQQAHNIAQVKLEAERRKMQEQQLIELKDQQRLIENERQRLEVEKQRWLEAERRKLGAQMERRLEDERRRLEQQAMRQFVAAEGPLDRPAPGGTVVAQGPGTVVSASIGAHDVGHTHAGGGEIEQEMARAAAADGAAHVANSVSSVVPHHWVGVLCPVCAVAVSCPAHPKRSLPWGCGMCIVEPDSRCLDRHPDMWCER